MVSAIDARASQLMQDPDKVPKMKSLIAKAIPQELTGRQVRGAFDDKITKKQQKAPPVSPNMLDYSA
jgi:hypothetical protein